MMAIVLGMVLSNARALPKRFQPGVKFSIKKLLPLGIILLDARLDFCHRQAGIRRHRHERF